MPRDCTAWNPQDMAGSQRIFRWQFGKFGGGILPLHREQASVGGEQMLAGFNELPHGGEGTAQDDSNLRCNCIAFGPRVDGLHIAQPERMRGLEQEAYFLAVAVDQEELQIGSADGKHQARQPSARADIGDAASVDERQYGQTVDHMQGQHMLKVLQPAEIVDSIPLVEGRQIRQELFVLPMGQTKLELVGGLLESSRQVAG